MTGPSPYRLAALIQQADAQLTTANAIIAQLQQVAVVAQAALAESETDRAELHTQVDNTEATLTALQQVAVTAQAALTDSEADRAALHQQLDALTARVTALEQGTP